MEQVKDGSVHRGHDDIYENDTIGNEALRTTPKTTPTRTSKPTVTSTPTLTDTKADTKTDTNTGVNADTTTDNNPVTTLQYRTCAG